MVADGLEDGYSTYPAHATRTGCARMQIAAGAPVCPAALSEGNRSKVASGMGKTPTAAAESSGLAIG
jgi:hypothetical protein